MLNNVDKGPLKTYAKYLFSRNGDLDLDLNLFTIERIMSPLICLNIPESPYPVYQNLATCKNHVFMVIQYHCFRDSTSYIEERSVSNVNKMITNLFSLISLPDSNELE